MTDERHKNSVGNFIDFLIERKSVTEQQAMALKSIHQQRLLFGMLACRMNMISVEQLHDVLIQQHENKINKRIGELFISKGLLSEDQVKEVLEYQKKEKQEDIPAELLMDIGILPTDIIEKEYSDFLIYIKESK